MEVFKQELSTLGQYLIYRCELRIPHVIKVFTTPAQ